MTETTSPTSGLSTQEDISQEKMTRVRVGATGLAVIVIVVLLAASFSGTASNEPELTPEAMAENSLTSAEGEVLAEEQPEEPLAELGVAPTTAATGETPDAEAADSAPAE